MSRWTHHKHAVFIRPALGLGLGLLLAAPLVHAADDDLRVSGFGTFGFSHDNADDLGFIRNSTQPQAESNNFSALTDSLLGVQANYRLSPEWEVVGQLVARDQADHSLGNALEWAYVSWRPNAQVDLRLGRVGMDAFLLSDYRHVGFAQTWVRPPNEFYSWIPTYSINGMDASYHFDTGDTHWQLKGQFGNASSTLPTGDTPDVDFSTNRGRIISLRATHGPWQFMGAISRMRVTSEGVNPTLSTFLDQAAGSPLLSPEARSEAAELSSGLWTKGATIRYNMLGVSYQEDVWQFQAEVAKIGADSPLFPSGYAGYAMLGRRFGKVTPYVIYSVFDPDNEGKQAQENWGVYTPVQTGAVASYNTYRIDQSTIALGARWDIGNRTDFKLQWDYKRVGARGYGLWQIDNQMHSDVDRNVNVFSAVLDFTF